MLKGCQKILERLQRLALISASGAFSTTPTAALEMLLGLPPLFLFIQKEAMVSYYRLRHMGHLRESDWEFSHCTIRTVLKHAGIPLNAPSDVMIKVDAN